MNPTDVDAQAYLYDFWGFPTAVAKVENSQVSSYVSSGSAAAGVTIENQTLYAASTGASTGQARLTYEFKIEGPTNQYVPVNITTQVKANSFGNEVETLANAWVWIVGSGPSGGRMDYSAENDKFYNYVQDMGDVGYANRIYEGQHESWGDRLIMQATVMGSMSVHDSFNSEIKFMTNAIYSVDMGVFAQTSIAGWDAFAWVDPFFMIDEEWVRNNPGYALSFSPGVGNVPGGSPVPEPTTCVLFGLGLLGFAGLSRKKA